MLNKEIAEQQQQGKRRKKKLKLSTGWGRGIGPREIKREVTEEKRGNWKPPEKKWGIRGSGRKGEG